MNYKELIKNTIERLKMPKVSDFLVLFVLIALAFNIAYPPVAQARTIEFAPELIIDFLKPKKVFKNRLPQNEDRPARWSTHITMTAYSSTVDQCDSTPCITASGFDLCEHGKEDIIASNYLPIGTKVRFPEIYGDRVFTVEDRMNSRYYKRADIWMKTREKAIDFGAKYIKMEVL